MREFHKPVLANEIISLLKPSGVFVDATCGGGGHSAEILKRIGPGGLLIGIDRDPEAIEYARKRLGEKAILVQGDFRDIESILRRVGAGEIDGALFDLGVSSHQLDADRGFSFSRDERLDMRMSAEEDIPTAQDIVNIYSESDLARLIRDYGEERYARRIAKAIVAYRAKRRIERTGELVEIILDAVPASYRKEPIHPATRTFQAIRIEVNGELEAVEKGVTAAVHALKPGGRICVVSFHSLEDRIVKRIFRRLAGACECPPRLPECRCGAAEMLKVITRKPVTPSADEIESNPRSRSAKLRCAERINPER